ncbi:heparin-binding EGF-like growth factor a isoform X2 [Oreochromis aureus]|uniref:Proheparin-binding EGF-like growth factor n=1 Tax=Oreochromis aureus TaxID=47969 RepID=A0A668T892_OREAU|nr:heparin-binding EGF-like growth factor a isoform X2 [Oreochromis aureus]
MRIFAVALLLAHVLVMSRLASGAAVDRYDSNKQRHTSVISLLDTTRDRRAEEENRGVRATTPDYSKDGEAEEYDDDYYYYEEYEDGTSGDYELQLPRVAMSSKPKDPSTILEAENTEGKTTRGKGKKKGKGKGRKRNPCLKKYKDYCIHGTCTYLRDLREPSCVCHHNYSGDRCQFILLPSQSREGYNRTTALAVVAVVLSSLCLTIIGLLLMLRQRCRNSTSAENEK